MWRKGINQFSSLKSLKSSLSLTPSTYSFRSFSFFTPPVSLTLYQYQICPFCNRLKAFLDHQKIKYETIEVNPTSKKEITALGFNKVPVMKIGDHIMDDSMKIIEYLRDSSIVKKDSNIQQLWTHDTEKWVKWSELKLAILLYPNITRTFGDAWKAFRYCRNVKSWTTKERLINRYVGPVAMYFATYKVKKKYGIIDERKELHEALLEWTHALGKNKFLHGDRITLPDLMIFGVLRGIHELPAFTHVMNENPALKVWYGNMEKSI